MTPTPKRRAKSSYAYSHSWVDQETFLSVKSELFDGQKRLVKTFFARKLTQESGVWIAKQTIVVNHKSGRMSMMQMKDLKVNAEIPEALLSTRALEDADFRRKNLSPLRK